MKSFYVVVAAFLFTNLSMHAGDFGLPTFSSEDTDVTEDTDDSEEAMSEDEENNGSLYFDGSRCVITLGKNWWRNAQANVDQKNSLSSTDDESASSEESGDEFNLSQPREINNVSILARKINAGLVANYDDIENKYGLSRDAAYPLYYLACKQNLITEPENFNAKKRKYEIYAEMHKKGYSDDQIKRKCPEIRSRNSFHGAKNGALKNELIERKKPKVLKPHAGPKGETKGLILKFLRDYAENVAIPKNSVQLNKAFTESMYWGKKPLAPSSFRGHVKNLIESGELDRKQQARCLQPNLH